MGQPTKSMRERLIDEVADLAGYHIDVLGRLDRKGAAHIVDQVLVTLRDPDEGMVVAGVESKPYNIKGHCEGKVYPLPQRSFTAMIDHVREGK